MDTSGKIFFRVPKNMVYDKLIYLFCLCNRKSTKFGRYKTIIDNGYDNFNEDLDLFKIT